LTNIYLAAHPPAVGPLAHISSPIPIGQPVPLDSYITSYLFALESHKVLGDIVALAGCTPASIGESKAWSDIVKATKGDRTEFCRVLSGKQLFSALYGMYSVALNDLKKGATDQCQENASAAEKTQHTRKPRRWLSRAEAS
jgi:hypothetical protein